MLLREANATLRSLNLNTSIEYRPSRGIQYVVRIGNREAAAQPTVIRAYQSAVEQLRMFGGR